MANQPDNGVADKSVKRATETDSDPTEQPNQEEDLTLETQ